jgi:hypothetical protein
MPVDSAHPDLSDLRDAVQLACQPTSGPKIVEGRRRVAEMPREWVLENIEAVGRSALNFTDSEWGSWEYGRFLEVLDVIGAHELLGRMVREGLASADVDVRDLAECWPKYADPAAG